MADTDVSGGPLVEPAAVPRPLRRLVSATARLDAAAFTRVPPPIEDNYRRAAVLILFGESGHGESGASDRDDPGDLDLLLLRRADTLGSHAGQVAFPGGGEERDDGGLVQTALREASEEVGVHPSSVLPLALLPGLYVPASRFMVTGVIAHWRAPGPVAAVDPAETAAVARIPVSHLADPENRIMVRRERYASPGFLVPGMLIWGFTAGVLAGLLRLAGWARPWDHGRVMDLDDAWRRARALPPAAAIREPEAGV